MKKYVDKDKLQEFATKLHAKQKTIFATRESIAPLVGSPLVASTAADMTNTTKVYVYVGSETGYTSGNWYYYDGSDWTSGGVYNSTALETDDTLSVAGMAADSKAVGDALAEMNDGLTDDIKQALLQIASKVAYIDEDGQDYYDALEAALYPDATLEYISAVYTQSGTVYDTDSLDSLKSDLVVTAHYSDYSTATITSYTLSGTLEEGTSTITVSYGGKTTTFNLTVSLNWTFEWDYTDGLPDNNGLTKEQTGSATISLESNGLNVAVALGSGYLVRYKYDDIGETVKSKTIEEIAFIINDYASVASSGLRVYNGLGGTGGTGATAKNCAELMLANNGTQTGIVWLAQVSGWSVITNNVVSKDVVHTLRLIQTDGSCEVYLDGTLIDTLTSFREAVAYPSFTVNQGMDVTIQSFKIKTEA